MKPAVFAYHRPTTVTEAVNDLARYAGAARVLAGGQSLVPMLNMRLWRPDALVDINELDELDAIEVRDDLIVLGALVRYTAIERSALLAHRLPLLADVVTRIGDRQVRNRGTIGGALVQGDPTGEVLLACMLLDAVVVAQSPGRTRRVPVRDLYEGSYATVLDPTELVTAVEFGRHPNAYAFGEITRKHNDFAIASVAAAGDRHDDGTWTDIRLAVGGVADTALRVSAAERILEGSLLTDADLDRATAAVDEIIDPPSDIRASAEYRRHLIPIQVCRVLRDLRASKSTTTKAGDA